MKIKLSQSYTECKRDDPPYGGEMRVAMALDRPLADAQALVRDPHKLVAETLQII